MSLALCPRATYFWLRPKHSGDQTAAHQEPEPAADAENALTTPHHRSRVRTLGRKAGKEHGKKVLQPKRDSVSGSTSDQQWDSEQII